MQCFGVMARRRVDRVNMSLHCTSLAAPRFGVGS